MNQNLQTDPMALASMACGLLSWGSICCSIFLILFACMGFLLAGVGIVLGGISIRNINQNPTQIGGKPFALAGIILSVLYFLAVIGVFVAAFFFGFGAGFLQTVM